MCKYYRTYTLMPNIFYEKVSESIKGPVEVVRVKTWPADSFLLFVCNSTKLNFVKSYYSNWFLKATGIKEKILCYLKIFLMFGSMYVEKIIMVKEEMVFKLYVVNI